MLAMLTAQISFAQKPLTSGENDIYYVNNGKNNSITLDKPTNSNAAVAIQSTTDYQAYGVHSDTFNTNVATNFSYNSEYQDPVSDLVYLRARDYDANTQRFITQDSANVWNKYNFADSNPIMNIDPSGHMPAWLNYTLNIAGFFGGIVAGTAAFYFSAGTMPMIAAVFGAAAGATGFAAQALGNNSGLQTASLVLGITSMAFDLTSGFSVMGRGREANDLDGIRFNPSLIDGFNNDLSEGPIQAAIRQENDLRQMKALNVFRRHWFALRADENITNSGLAYRLPILLQQREDIATANELRGVLQQSTSLNDALDLPISFPTKFERLFVNTRAKFIYDNGALNIVGSRGISDDYDINLGVFISTHNRIGGGREVWVLPSGMRANAEITLPSGRLLPLSIETTEFRGWFLAIVDQRYTQI